MGCSSSKTLSSVEDNSNNAQNTIFDQKFSIHPQNSSPELDNFEHQDFETSIASEANGFDPIEHQHSLQSVSKHQPDERSILKPHGNFPIEYHEISLRSSLHETINLKSLTISPCGQQEFSAHSSNSFDSGLRDCEQSDVIELIEADQEVTVNQKTHNFNENLPKDVPFVHQDEFNVVSPLLIPALGPRPLSPPHPISFIPLSPPLDPLPPPSPPLPPPLDPLPPPPFVLPLSFFPSNLPPSITRELIDPDEEEQEERPLPIISFHPPLPHHSPPLSPPRYPLNKKKRTKKKELSQQRRIEREEEQLGQERSILSSISDFHARFVLYRSLVQMDRSSLLQAAQSSGVRRELLDVEVEVEEMQGQREVSGESWRKSLSMEIVRREFGDLPSLPSPTSLHSSSQPETVPVPSHSQIVTLPPPPQPQTLPSPLLQETQPQKKKKKKKPLPSSTPLLTNPHPSLYSDLLDPEESESTSLPPSSSLPSPSPVPHPSSPPLTIYPLESNPNPNPPSLPPIPLSISNPIPSLVPPHPFFLPPPLDHVNSVSSQPFFSQSQTQSKVPNTNPHPNPHPHPQSTSTGREREEESRGSPIRMRRFASASSLPSPSPLLRSKPQKNLSSLSTRPDLLPSRSPSPIKVPLPATSSLYFQPDQPAIPPHSPANQPLSSSLPPPLPPSSSTPASLLSRLRRRSHLPSHLPSSPPPPPPPPTHLPSHPPPTPITSTSLPLTTPSFPLPPPLPDPFSLVEDRLLRFSLHSSHPLPLPLLPTHRPPPPPPLPLIDQEKLRQKEKENGWASDVEEEGEERDFPDDISDITMFTTFSL